MIKTGAERIEPGTCRTLTDKDVIERLDKFARDNGGISADKAVELLLNRNEGGSFLASELLGRRRDRQTHATLDTNPHSLIGVIDV